MKFLKVDIETTKDFLNRIKKYNDDTCNEQNISFNSMMDFYFFFNNETLFLIKKIYNNKTSYESIKNTDLNNILDKLINQNIVLIKDDNIKVMFDGIYIRNKKIMIQFKN